jgi:hypothetical protein
MGALAMILVRRSGGSFPSGRVDIRNFRSVIGRLEGDYNSQLKRTPDLVILAWKFPIGKDVDMLNCWKMKTTTIGY